MSKHMAKGSELIVFYLGYKSYHGSFSSGRSKFNGYRQFVCDGDETPDEFVDYCYDELCKEFGKGNVTITGMTRLA